MRIKTMNAVNALQLLILAWTFTAVCQADDDDISVICEDVTGTVGEEVTLTCSVSLSLKCTNSCIINYKFQYPEGDSKICKEFPQGSCKQRNSVTCRFTPTTAMTGQFRFFVQTKCGSKTTEFTVNTTEPIKHEPVNEDPGKKDPKIAQQVKSITVAGSGSKNTVIATVVSCFIIIVIIIIIITLTIIYKTKSNYQPQCIPVFLGRRHEDNSNCPVNVI